MKNLKAVLIMVTGLFITNSVAQAKNATNIPQTVMLSFSNKYPGAIIKRWELRDNNYTAKAIIDGHKYFATFDKDGNWISTASNTNFAYKMPKVINSAYKRSPYNNWAVYFAKRVEKPSGEYYQLLVDDVNLHVGINHQLVYTQDKMMEFKADGELTGIKDITFHPEP